MYLQLEPIWIYSIWIFSAPFASIFSQTSLSSFEPFKEPSIDLLANFRISLGQRLWFFRLPVLFCALCFPFISSVSSPLIYVIVSSARFASLFIFLLRCLPSSSVIVSWSSYCPYSVMNATIKAICVFKRLNFCSYLLHFMHSDVDFIMLLKLHYSMIKPSALSWHRTTGLLVPSTWNLALV